MAQRRGKGEGGITQRHDHKTCPPLVDGERPDHRCQGRWVATIDLPASSGKRMRKALYGRTRKEVAIKLAAAREDKRKHVLVAGSPTVEAWFTHWLDVVCVERGLKLNTLRSHRSKVKTYVIPHLGRVRLDRLEPEHVRRMYGAMRDQGLSEATLRQTHAIMRRALTVAVRERKAPVNVLTLIDPPGTLKKRRDPLSVEDARKVLARGGLRWHLALWLGLRQGEALALRWSDVDLERGYLHVARSLVRIEGGRFMFDSPKTASSVRYLPLPTPVRSRLTVGLAEHLASGGGPDALMFTHDGGPVPHRRDWQTWRDLLADCGVAHVPLHAARNTTASLLEAAGVQDRVVAQILGQSTVQVTHGYQTADLPRLGAAIKQLEGLLEAGD